MNAATIMANIYDTFLRIVHIFEGKKEKWLFRYVVGGPKKQQNLFLHASHVNCNGQGLIKAHIHTQMGYIKSRV